MLITVPLYRFQYNLYQAAREKRVNAFIQQLTPKQLPSTSIDSPRWLSFLMAPDIATKDNHNTSPGGGTGYTIDTHHDETGTCYCENEIPYTQDAIYSISALNVLEKQALIEKLLTLNVFITMDDVTYSLTLNNSHISQVLYEKLPKPEQQHWLEGHIKRSLGILFQYHHQHLCQWYIALWLDNKPTMDIDIFYACLFNQASQTNVRPALLESLIQELCAEKMLPKNPLHAVSHKGAFNTASLLILKSMWHHGLLSQKMVQSSLMHRLVETNNMPLIMALLDEGLAVHQVDQNGKNLIYKAAVKNLFPLVIRLQQRGDDINWADWQGNTALHKAVLFNDTEMINLLKNYGAKVTPKNKKGLTAKDRVRNKRC